jgi:hypothetical protein
MIPSQSFFTHWYFHVPNLLMAALMYALVGRYLLMLIFGAGSDRFIVRVFRHVTDPVLGVVDAVTPRIVPVGLLIVFAIVWLFVARVLLFFVLALMGIRPVLG